MELIAVQERRRFEAVIVYVSLCRLKRSSRANMVIVTNITSTIIIAFSLDRQLNAKP
ncbi:unnamed protein product [Sphenostylis stenocarpa]|uniref:Uncharacterized protein n=1 Tax=Sphenostylis stenocarpa TaxID=92480 RepID=A0AA86T6E9_9FABA|nr:unnamed protein product [Sphenostylis stenocarpa]